ncbi:MAG: SAM-dependent methyltransferase, partial [Rickettsiales bacterium]|nr:SAM-dependent methyltransferase [Rickettsiales bacterium]
MSEALFKDETGYYRTKNPIGKNADFITAPEISQVFGEILAAYFLQIADNKKSKISKEKIAKKKISFVEMGAGKGTLFLDILNSIKKLALKKIPQALDFLEATTFHIIEINEVLQKIQQQNLQQFNNISWYKNFADFAQKN